MVPVEKTNTDRPSVGDGRRLDRTLISGLAWTGLFKWMGQLISWVSTLIVARILSPDDFGLVGMTAAYMALVLVISESGLSVSVVANQRLNSTQLSQLNGLAMLLGSSGFVLSCLTAVPLARFFQAPDLTWVVIGMSTTLIISSLRAVPGALLQRDMDFKVLALIEGIQAIVQGITVVILALLGFEYWSLVLGAVVGASVAVALVLFNKRCGFAWPRSSAIGESFLYARRILGAQLTWYVVANADVLIVGRLLGQSLVGVYALTLALATAPLQKITSLVARVAFPIFSRVQSDHEALKRYLLAMTEGLSLICFPLAIGLALEASKFVPVVLGEKWNEAIVPMQLLSVLTAMRSVAPLIPQVLNVIGGVRFSMYNGVFAAIVAPVAFYVGAEKAGLAGVAAGWIITIVLTSPPVYWAVMRRTGLSVSRYLKSMWPAFSACVVMVLSVLGMRWFLNGTNVEPVWQLLFEIAAGALAYIGTVLALHRERLVTFLSVIRRGQSDSPPQFPGSPVQVAVEDTNR